MGIAEIVAIASSTYKALRGASGKTVNVKATGIGGAGIEAEYYQAGGVFHRPPRNVRGIFLPIGPGRRYGVVISGVAYKLNIEVEDGETVIYSTDASGINLKAKIRLGADGKIAISNQIKSLKTVLASLIDHLSGLTTINCVPGSPVTLNPAVIAQLTQDKVDLTMLLKD